MTPSHETPEYGSIDIRSSNTGAALLGLAPWNYSGYTHSIVMLYLGYDSISKLEVITLLNFNNMSRSILDYYGPNRTKKYNPKVYIGKINNIAYGWNFDEETGQNKKEIPWPESLNLIFIDKYISILYRNFNYMHFLSQFLLCQY